MLYFYQNRTFSDVDINMNALTVSSISVKNLQANPLDLVPAAPDSLFDPNTSQGVRWAWVPEYAHWNGFAHSFDYVEYTVNLASASVISKVEVVPFDKEYLIIEGWKCKPDRILINGVEINLPTSYDPAETTVNIGNTSSVTVRIEGSFGFTYGNVHQRVVVLNGILFYA